MGWTNLDDEFVLLGKHKKIAELMDGLWTPEHALGVMMLFWGRSQKELVTLADREDIKDFASSDTPMKPQELDRFIEALCHKRVGVLELIGENSYRIRGNEKHVDRIKKLKDASKKGGEANRQRLRATIQDSQEGEPCGSNDESHEATHMGSLAAEVNSIQGNAIQGNTQIQETPNGVSSPVAKTRSRGNGASRQTFRIDSDEGFHSRIPPDTIARWHELYSVAFVARELKKAFNWLDVNPEKSRKSVRGWTKFFGGWFDRSWDNHAKGIPSNRPASTWQPPPEPGTGGVT